MAETIDYDSSPDALFRPGRAVDLFAYGPYPTRGALCAELSRLAYVRPSRRRDRPGLEDYLHRGGFELIAFDESGGSEGFLAANDALVVLVFRGTESDDPRDLFTDVDLVPRRWRLAGRPAGWVHGGFAKGLERIGRSSRAFPKMIARC